IVGIGVRTADYVTGRKGQPHARRPRERVWGRLYVDGSVAEGYEDVTADNWPDGAYVQVDGSDENPFTEAVKKEIRLADPLHTDVVTTHTAEEAYHLVLKYAGSSKQRDIIDARIVEETQNGTAAYFGSISADAKDYPGFIDIPEDVKPIGAKSAWPDLTSGGLSPELLQDTDGDGMPDWWERKNGLD